MSAVREPEAGTPHGRFDDALSVADGLEHVPSPRLPWLAPLLVGAAAAVAAEVAVGILLYAGPGLMRSLTTVLGVEGAALGLGLWTAPGARPDLVDQLRRRWVMCLIAFLGAALFSTSWSAIEDIGGGRLGQGIGLAVMAAFPLYAAGTVLGGMGAVARSDPTGRLAPPGAAAALGAALGFVATGVLLPRAPMPASLLVACLVMLSLAGMTYGSVLNRRLQVHVRAFRPARTGDVRVEDRRVAATGRAARLLVEGRHVRSRVPLEADGPVPWDVAVVRAAMPSEEADWRVLVVGGGASLAPCTVLREHPRATVDVLERSAAVLELAREHLDTGLRVEHVEPSAAGAAEPAVGVAAPAAGAEADAAGGAEADTAGGAEADTAGDAGVVPTGDAEAGAAAGAAAAAARGGAPGQAAPRPRLTLLVGNLEDLLERVRAPYDLVLVDSAALAAMGGSAALSRRAREALLGATGDRGALVWGPLPPDPGAPELAAWRSRLLRRSNGRHDEVLLVTGPSEAASLPESFDGFLEANGGPAPA